MTLPELTLLVRRSTLINNDEREYWLSALSTMKSPQIAKLETILTEAEKIPLEESVHQYFQSLGAPAAPPLAA